VIQRQRCCTQNADVESSNLSVATIVIKIRETLLSVYTNKQIKNWNKDIDKAIDLLVKIKKLTQDLRRAADEMERTGKPVPIMSNKKIEDFKRKFKTVNTRVILIPREARPYTNYSKFEKIFFSN
jgi:hypothetical protein